MTTAKYKIVEFSDGLSIVPRSWLSEDGKSCRWPSYTSQFNITKSVINMENPTKSWNTLSTLKVWSSAGTYCEAKKKLEIYEVTSDSESYMKDDKLKKTRHDRAKKNYSDESSDESVSKRRKISTPPRLDTSLKAILDNCSKEVIDERSNSANTQGSATDENSDKGIKTASTTTNHLHEDVEMIKFTDDTGLHNVNMQKSTVDDKIDGMHQKSLEKIRKTSDGGNDLTIAYLEEIIYLQNKQGIEIEEIKKALKHGKIISTKNRVQKSHEVEWSIILPLNDVDQIKSYDLKLKSDSELKNALIDMLKCLGGKDDRIKVNTMMEKLLSDDVGSKFSTKGQKGKESLMSLELGKAILEAMLQCANDYTETDIKAQMGFWLAGRKAKIDRNKKKLENTGLQNN